MSCSSFAQVRACFRVCWWTLSTTGGLWAVHLSACGHAWLCAGQQVGHTMAVTHAMELTWWRWHECCCGASALVFLCVNALVVQAFSLGQRPAKYWSET